MSEMIKVVKENNIEAVKALFKKGDNVNIIDKYGYTPLGLLKKNGDYVHSITLKSSELVVLPSTSPDTEIKPN